MSQFLLLQPKHCYPSRDPLTCSDTVENSQCKNDKDCGFGRCCHKAFFNMHSYCGICECETEKDCPTNHCCRHDNVVSQYLLSQKKRCYRQMRLDEECSTDFEYQCGCEKGLSCQNSSIVLSDDDTEIYTCQKSAGSERILGFRGNGK